MRSLHQDTCCCCCCFISSWLLTLPEGDLILWSNVFWLWFFFFSFFCGSAVWSKRGLNVPLGILLMERGPPGLAQQLYVERSQQRQHDSAQSWRLHPTSWRSRNYPLTPLCPKNPPACILNLQHITRSLWSGCTVQPDQEFTGARRCSDCLSIQTIHVRLQREDLIFCVQLCSRRSHLACLDQSLWNWNVEHLLTLALNAQDLLRFCVLHGRKWRAETVCIAGWRAHVLRMTIRMFLYEEYCKATLKMSLFGSDLCLYL